MKYHKTDKCGLLCQLSKFVRKAKWHSVKPLSKVRHDNHKAIHKHFGRAY